MTKGQSGGWTFGDVLSVCVFTAIAGTVLLPIVVAIEIKAWLARHRIRKEQG